MTLANCKKLLDHFEKLARGEGIPENHMDKGLVIANAKKSAEAIKARLLAKGGQLEVKEEEKTKSKKGK